MMKILFLILYLMTTAFCANGMNSDVAAFTSRTLEGGSINSSTLLFCNIYLKGGIQPTINSSTLIGVDFYSLDDDGNKKKCSIETSHSSLIIGKAPFRLIGTGILLYIVFLYNS